MQLTRYTDYGLRVLIYLASAEDGASVAELASKYGISRNHLVKVAHHLTKLGYIESTRGRAGGMHLAIEPEEITVGKIVRELEPDMNIVECFAPNRNTCPIAPACKLKRLLEEATQSFLAVLDQYTLADVVQNKTKLMKLLNN